MESDLARLFGVKPKEMYCEFIGLNHLSWIKKVSVSGKDVTEQLFDMDLTNRNIVANITEIPENLSVIKSIRLIPSPYLNYFYFEANMLSKELESVKNGKGTRAAQVKELEKELFDIYKNPELDSKPEQLTKRGGSLYSEAAISLIQSIHTDSGAIHVLNTPNRGAIADLDMDSVVETNCLVKNSGVYPIVSGKLPEVIKPLVLSVKAYEKLTIEAAVTGSREKALQALICHPLIHDMDKAVELLADILEAHKEYLEIFFEEGVVN
jgi:6-phospho-beta-glucosidase